MRTDGGGPGDRVPVLRPHGGVRDQDGGGAVAVGAEAVQHRRHIYLCVHIIVL